MKKQISAKTEIWKWAKAKQKFTLKEQSEVRNTFQCSTQARVRKKINRRFDFNQEKS